MATVLTPPPYSNQNLATVPGGVSALQPTSNGAPLAAIRSGQIESGILQTAAWVLTAADIVAMGAGNGVLLLNPPPSCYSSILSLAKAPTIVCYGGWAELQWPTTGGVAYTGGGAASIVYTAGAITTLATIPAALFTNSAVTSYWIPQASASAILTTAGLALGISIVNTGGVFAAGNSTVYLKLYYALNI